MDREEAVKRQEATYERVSRRDPAIRTETVYYENEGIQHAMEVCYPNKDAFPGKRPGILFFCGGGFAIGSRFAFREHCEILAKQGITAATADYRIYSIHGTEAADSFRDGAAAWRFFCTHAEEWEMDAGKLFLSGGSAGAMIAHMCGQMTGIQPAGYVMYNPGIINTKKSSEGAETGDVTDGNLVSLTGEEVDGFKVLNMCSLVPGMPPVLVMHGEKDHIISAETVQNFVNCGIRSGVDARLKLYPGMDHGFYNYNRSRAHFYMTIGETLAFLQELTK